jgi:predicted TIM-barrel fold metal-dependent hydrolase
MKPETASLRVDTHFHVFEAGQGTADARYIPRYTAAISAWWQQASAAGVTHGVLIQPSFLGTDNRLMLAAVALYPELLRAVAVVSPDVSGTELDALHGAGVRGVRLNFAGLAHDMTAWRSAHALWDALLQRDWHVQVHADTGRLGEVLPHLPGELRVVVDHMGRPLSASPTDPTLALLRRWHPGRLHVKLSGAYRQQGPDPAALARALHDELGPQALLWGSDWPCTNHEDCADYRALLGQLDAWLPAGTHAAVLRDNPLRLYWKD